MCDLNCFFLSQNDLQNLEDASDELLMVDDESQLVPYVVGEVFAHLGLEEAKVWYSSRQNSSSKSKISYLVCVI